MSAISFVRLSSEDVTEGSVVKLKFVKLQNVSNVTVSVWMGATLL